MPPQTTRASLLVASVLAATLTGCTAEPVPPVQPGGVAGATSSTSRTSSATASPTSATSAASPSPTPSSATSQPAAPAALELPRGGRTVFPRYRLMGYSGLTGAAALGRLGTGDLDQRVREIERRGQRYRQGRELLPVLEVITTIVNATPGPDGKYRSRISDKEIARYHRAARRHRALLLLNLQPGRSTFLAEAKAYRKWLAKPDVGLALDPEWAMAPGQVPGRVYGHSTGAELSEVAAYLSRLAVRHDLPEKVMVYHQVAATVVRRESALRDHPRVAVIKSVDGIGSAGAKIETYRHVNKTTPKFVHAGFKLFFTEDRKHGPLMTPREVLALKPKPEYVLYE